MYGDNWSQLKHYDNVELLVLLLRMIFWALPHSVIPHSRQPI